MSGNDKNDDKKWGVRKKCGGKFSRQELISLFSASQKEVISETGHAYTLSSLSGESNTHQQTPKKKF